MIFRQKNTRITNKMIQYLLEKSIEKFNLTL
jgi:hypothetical protein